MKRVFLISIIAAFIVSSFPAFSVSAAPSTASSGSDRIWGQQLKELQAHRAFYTHFVTDRKNFKKPADPIKLKRDLVQFAAVLKIADTIINNSSLMPATDTKNMTNRQVNSQNQIHQNAEKELARHLQALRGLREKINQDS